jgi:hypothetical protein
MRQLAQPLPSPSGSTADHLSSPMSATIFTWRRMACRAPAASRCRIASRIWRWARSERRGRPGSLSELRLVSLIGTASPAMKSASRGLQAAWVTA